MWFASLEVIFQAKQVWFSSPGDRTEWQMYLSVSCLVVFFLTANLKDHSR